MSGLGLSGRCVTAGVGTMGVALCFRLSTSVAWQSGRASVCSLGDSAAPRRQDFTSAVMDVDYSPTGREFVAGSYDRSLRIFGHTGGRSREVSTPSACR